MNAYLAPRSATGLAGTNSTCLPMPRSLFAPSGLLQVLSLAAGSRIVTRHCAPVLGLGTTTSENAGAYPRLRHSNACSRPTLRRRAGYHAPAAATATLATRQAFRVLIRCRRVHSARHLARGRSMPRVGHRTAGPIRTRGRCARASNASRLAPRPAGLAAGASLHAPSAHPPPAYLAISSRTLRPHSE